MPFSDTCLQVNCAANVAQTFTIPGNSEQQYQAYFSYNENANVFVCKNGTPSIPVSGASGQDQYNEFKPKKRYVRGGDVLHFITPDTNAYIGMSLRKLQG